MQLSLGFAPQTLRLSVLGSGSSGNALVLESGDRRLMVDAGFSCRELERRLDLLGVAPGGFVGIVLTHEHGDHCRGALRFARRHGVPILATAGTLTGLGLDGETDVATGVLRSGAAYAVAPFTLRPFAVPHDAREPIGVVVEDGAGHRVGVIADIGTASRLAWGRLTDLDVLVVETNHDPEMLRQGPYPWHLKQRIAGRRGHLSNREAADGVAELVSERLKWVVLYHLSTTNNLPALAAEAVLEVLDREGSAARICVSEQVTPTAWLGVRGDEAWVEEIAVDESRPE